MAMEGLLGGRNIVNKVIEMQKDRVASGTQVAHVKFMQGSATWDDRIGARSSQKQPRNLELSSFAVV